MSFNCQAFLKEHLGEQLYTHSTGVAKAAADLAALYGENSSRAYLAGLLHDYGKIYSAGELCRKAHQNGLLLDRITRAEPRLLHAPVGAVLLKNELLIDDPGIIKAVAYHTTGRRRMELLEKIIYLADYIEEGRNFPGVEIARKVAFLSLEKALLIAVDRTIKAVLERGMLLHPRSIAFRNSLLLPEK